MPGQKSIRLAKKGGDPSFPGAGFRRFSPGISFPRVSLRKPGGENRESFSRPFLASAPAFLTGQQGDRAERPTKWDMILTFKRSDEIPYGTVIGFFGFRGKKTAWYFPVSAMVGHAFATLAPA